MSRAEAFHTLQRAAAYVAASAPESEREMVNTNFPTATNSALQILSIAQISLLDAASAWSLLN